MRKLTMGVATLAMAGVVTAVTAGAAFATGTDVSVGGAQLVARGAGVDVTLNVTCDPYTDYWGNYMTSTPVNVSVSETVRRGLISTGSGSGTAICDSTPHTVTVLVTAPTYAFIRGSALVTVTPTFDVATSPSQTVIVRIK